MSNPKTKDLSIDKKTILFNFNFTGDLEIARNTMWKMQHEALHYTHKRVTSRAPEYMTPST